MRIVQVLLLCLGVFMFAAATFFTGTDTGLTLWYTGVAILLVDVVVCLIWPTGVRAKEKGGPVE